MEIRELCNLLKLNQAKISKLAYLSNSCHPERNHVEIILPVLRQIAINVHVVYRNFDRMHVDEIAYNMRKNGIKAFIKDLHPNSTNPNKRSEYVQKHLRQSAKSRILFIHNTLLDYIQQQQSVFTTSDPTLINSALPV